VNEQLDELLKAVITDPVAGVSFRFTQATSGRYERVLWGEGAIEVENRDGELFEVEQLSTGTQDQLFFALRLGILTRAFPQGAFLALDDAFLTSDEARRTNQVLLCKSLAEEGWQVLYLTVDCHIRDLFQDLCGIAPRLL
jgi:uncharacterized protein YhaN